MLASAQASSSLMVLLDNHKPNLETGTRKTTLQSTSGNNYDLTLRDSKGADSDIFVFNGSRTAPSKPYVLVFDQTTQKATLERLDNTYTFNLSSKNGTDISSDYGKIYPKKSHKDSVHDKEEGEVDLFGEEHGDEANEGTEPDASNPYDFRHFLNGVKKQKDKEGEGYASSPDYRSATGSNTANTPVLPARRAVEPAKKRKAASVFASKPTAKGGSKKPAAAAPSINLERRATERPAPASPKAVTTSASSGSKIKSAEFVQESDESDVDAEGEIDSNVPSPKHMHTRRSPSPGQREDDDEDAEGEEDDNDNDDHDDAGDLEIEIPDARPSRPQTHRHTSHLDVSASRGPRSPSNGPISLASAANSVENTPRRGAAAEEIDFGDLGGDDAEGEEDEDVDAMDIGPPARQDTRKSVSGAAGGSGAAEVDEDDPLYMEMMEGLAGGDSSEESEEE